MSIEKDAPFVMHFCCVDGLNVSTRKRKLFLKRINNFGRMSVFNAAINS